jgi:hypothetical protein
VLFEQIDIVTMRRSNSLGNRAGADVAFMKARLSLLTNERNDLQNRDVNQKTRFSVIGGNGVQMTPKC